MFSGWFEELQLIKRVKLAKFELRNLHSKHHGYQRSLDYTKLQRF
jgi:hypothetical protein